MVQTTGIALCVPTVVLVMAWSDVDLIGDSRVYSIRHSSKQDYDLNPRGIW